MTGKPSLGIVSATTIVAASMIGVGVYTTSGFTLAALGSPTRVIAAWMVAGVIAICGAIGYASLAVRFAESGGEYLFLSRSLHPIAGLTAGLVSMLAGFTGAIAVAAIGLEKYAGPIFAGVAMSVPANSIAITVVIAAALLHTVGVRGGSAIQNGIVIAKLLMIAGFIGCGLVAPAGWDSGDLTPPPTNVGAASSVFTFAQQLVWISFSFAGFNAAVYVAGEVENPRRNVPRALIGGTVLVTLIYIALNTVFVRSATIGVLTSEPNISQIAATAAQAIGGHGFGLLVRIVIVVSLLTSVSAMVMTGPRVYAKMADDGFMPAWFRFGDRPPVLAIWFQAALAIIAIVASSLTQLLGYLGLTLSVCSALSVAMLFVLKRRGEIESLPLGGIPPAMYVLATSVIAGLYAIREPVQAIAASLTLVAGILAYATLQRWK